MPLITTDLFSRLHHLLEPVTATRPAALAYQQHAEAIGEDVIEAMRIAERPVDVPCAAGSLPIDSLHSWVLTADLEPAGPGSLLSVTRGALAFCNLWAGMFVSRIPCDEDDGDELGFSLASDALEAHEGGLERATHRLADLLAATHTFENPLLAERYQLERPELRLATLLRVSGERFLMAGLASMVSRPDFALLERRPWQLLDGREVLRVHPHERAVFESDLSALLVVQLIGTLEGIPTELACWGVDLYLMGLEVLDASREVAEMPPAYEVVSGAARRQFLRAALRKFKPEEAPGIISFWDRSAVILNELNAAVQPLYEASCDRIGRALKSVRP